MFKCIKRNKKRRNNLLDTILTDKTLKSKSQKDDDNENDNENGNDVIK